MFTKNKIPSAERQRLLDFLLFKIKHGGNIVSALQSYMAGNQMKQSFLVGEMLKRVQEGDSFFDAAYQYGLVDYEGYLILSTSVEPAKALAVIKERNDTRGGGVTVFVFTEILKKLGVALAFGVLMAMDATRKPMIEVFTKMNQAAISAGSTPEPVPIYLIDNWLVLRWVLVFIVITLTVLAGLWHLNRTRTDIIYRIFPFRFYEDWTGLLDMYMAFKLSGQSDHQAAISLVKACKPDSFNAKLFADIAASMKNRGSSFYEVMLEYEKVFPSVILSFFMDASKTGQVNAYIGQAKKYCVDRLAYISTQARMWIPAITGVVMLMTFGLMIADLFVSITKATMSPIAG